MPAATRFKLRFPESQIPSIARVYDVKRWRDESVEVLGRSARKRGFYTKKEFVRLCAWKSPRTGSRCEANEEDVVQETTRIALSTPVEQLRIEVLSLLSGVSWPTASVILHFGHHEPYPILDFRALWSLSATPPKRGYAFEFWWRYVEATRALAARAHVKMRSLDRALWQYSRDNQ
jgi:hypothetical protein